MKSVSSAVLATILVLFTFWAQASEANVLRGYCVIQKAGQPAQLANIAVQNGDSVEVSTIKVSVPKKGANDDIYFLLAWNNAGFDQMDGIALQLVAQRTFCNPPSLDPDVINPCSRPAGWENLEDQIKRIVTPNIGDVVTLESATPEVAVSCKATYQEQ